jgi:uncharacterized protein YukE
MRGVVRVQYDEISSIVKKLNHSGIEMAELTSTTIRRLNALRLSWIGDAATEFFNEMDSELIPAVNRVISAVVLAQDVAIKVVRTFKVADEETTAYFKVDLIAGELMHLHLSEGGLVAGTVAAGIAGAVAASSATGFGKSDSESAALEQPEQSSQNAAGQAGENFSSNIDTKQHIESATEKKISGASDSRVNDASDAGGGAGSSANRSGLQGNLNNLGTNLEGVPGQSSRAGGMQGKYQ